VVVFIWFVLGCFAVWFCVCVLALVVCGLFVLFVCWCDGLCFDELAVFGLCLVLVVRLVGVWFGWVVWGLFGVCL